MYLNSKGYCSSVEHQSVRVDGKDLRVKILIGRDGVKESFDVGVKGVRVVEVSLPKGVYVDTERSVFERGTLRLRVSEVAKPAAVCVVDEEGREWCNQDVFNSGVPPARIERWFKNLSAVVKLLKDNNSSFREALDHIIISFDIVRGPEQVEGVVAAGHTEFGEHAPVCKVHIPAAVLESENLFNIMRVVSHEVGHCLDAYHKRLRYIEEAVGGWKVKGERVIPVGAEKVAEKYSYHAMRRVAFNK